MNVCVSSLWHLYSDRGIISDHLLVHVFIPYVPSTLYTVATKLGTGDTICIRQNYHPLDTHGGGDLLNN